MIQTKRRAFVDAITGRPLSLAGSHTWNTVQAFNGKTAPLNALVGNFTRLWTVETRGMILEDSPWGSNSKGLAKVSDVPWKKDGSLNNRYYQRLEAVVKKAASKDIITGVVLFDHAFNAYFPKGWENHPFYNLGPSNVTEIHTKGSWTKYQRAHVKRTTKILEQYDNVIYEVGNELHSNSVPWFQRKVVQWVRKWTDKPVGVSYASGLKPSRGRSQNWMAATGADWVAPSQGERIDGFKGVYIFDTDHVSALRSNVSGLRSAWRRGDSLWLMDGLNGHVLRNQNSLHSDRMFILNALN